MAISERQLLDALSRTPFVDSTELAHILGEPHATVRRTRQESGTRKRVQLTEELELSGAA